MDAKSGAKAGTLTIGNKNYNVPLYEGTTGPDVVDISKLYDETGVFTYDPGYTSTASCKSKITFVDGDEGVLLYRGYPIEQLAEHGDFLETTAVLSRLPPGRASDGGHGRLRRRAVSLLSQLDGHFRSAPRG